LVRSRSSLTAWAVISAMTYTPQKIGVQFRHGADHADTRAEPKFAMTQD
jgi:hypothetical protein